MAKRNSDFKIRNNLVRVSSIMKRSPRLFCLLSATAAAFGAHGSTKPNADLSNTDG